jgi:Fur family ferric uptake transcriptional regulator
MLDPNKALRQEFITLFRKNEMPLTPESEEVVKFFFSSEAHLSKEEIRDALKKKDIYVSAETVSKVIDLLLNYGFAQEVSFREGPPRYEHFHLQTHHDHFVCQRCRKIIEFSDEELEILQMKIAGHHGFHVFNHQMNLYGLCDTCYGKDEQAPVPLSSMLPDSDAVIEDIRVDSRGHQRRVQELGLRKGKQLRVISNNPGMMVASIDGNRVAFPRGLAHKIMVRINVP